MQTRLAVQLAVILGALTGPLGAQQRDVVTLSWERADVHRRGEQEDQRRQQRKQYLTTLINRIDESLGLTAAQRRKLIVASKGAVEYSFEADQNKRPAKRHRVLGGLGGVQQRWLIKVRGVDDAAAAQHPIWKKTLSRMFTQQQLSQIALLEQEQLPANRRRVEVWQRRRQMLPAIELRQFKRLHVDDFMIRPVWPRPVLVDRPPAK